VERLGGGAPDGAPTRRAKDGDDAVPQVELVERAGVENAEQAEFQTGEGGAAGAATPLAQALGPSAAAALRAAAAAKAAYATLAQQHAASAAGTATEGAGASSRGESGFLQKKRGHWEFWPRLWFELGLYPIVTLEKQLPSMIGNLV
jgi:hypothetical protein